MQDESPAGTTKSDTPPITVAVTGANGYVGSVLAESLRREGMNVIALQRSVTSDDTTRKFSLDEPATPELFAGVNALVHCAYDFRVADRTAIWRTNVDGSIRLLQSAKSAGIQRIVFISTMSAFPSCKSMYGQAKLAIEDAAKSLGVQIVRPGLVYGRSPRGMVGSLLKLVSLPLVTPMVGFGGQVLYLVHEEDLGALVNTMVRGDVTSSEPVIAAHDRGRTLREIVDTLGRASGCTGGKLHVPVPGGLLYAGLRSLEMIGLRPRVRSDSLVSLLNQQVSPDFGPTRHTGVGFREFNEASLVQTDAAR
jgi:nucleoside-diphosphate-sugar epimerase